MSQNVRLRSGWIQTLVPDTTQNVTGDWKFKDADAMAVQATVSGTGTVTATATIQVSNDGVNVAVTSATIALSGTTPQSGGAVVTGPWKYVRAVISAIAGTGATANVTASI